MALLYHSDDDLVEIRPDILSYGVTDFEVQQTESETIINRTLDAQWYRNVALNSGLNWRETPFDATLILHGEEQLGRLACYKSLQLIYLYLMKEAIEPDAFERQMNTFKKLYQEELSEVLNAGIDYDFSGDGTIAADESSLPVVRRLVRV